MNARMRRIAADYEQIKKEFDGHDNILVEPLGGEPPEKYRVTYFIEGIYLGEGGQAERLSKHVVLITLHTEYPRYKPLCTIETPIWHPNFRDGQICIGDIWGAGESLADIIVNIGDMIQYKAWNSYSPLSADAAAWAIEHKEMFPVGNMNLWKGASGEENAEAGMDIDLWEESAFDVTEMEEDAPVTVEIPSGEEPSKANDIEIEAKELEGIEFVPAEERMQRIQSGSLVKRQKINFKTVFLKGILYGLIGGALGFGLAEVTNWDPVYTSANYAFLIFLSTATFVATMCAGIGAVMGIGEGVYYGSISNALRYGAIGLCVSLGVGFVGGLIGQFIYGSFFAMLTSEPGMLYFSITRAVAWAILGASVGLAIGLIKPHGKRIAYCVLGGTIGGFLGGLSFDWIAIHFSLGVNDTGTVSRAVGIILMGLLVGLGIGLLEQLAKPAWLKVIRGEFEGKEYLVFSTVTSIGNSGKNTIALFKDRLVAPKHCEIVLERGTYFIIDKGSLAGTIVNGMRASKRALRSGDTIALGNSVLVFHTK